MKPTTPNEHSPNERIAYIYSISDLSQYIVQIQYQKESFFIEKSGEQETFLSMDLAVEAAKSKGCSHGYVCLENTYNELGPIEPEQRFSCSKIF